MPTIQERLAALPLATYRAGETVLAEGTKTGRLWILKSGAVSVVKGDTEIAKVAEPGAVFGELSALLDRPHTATFALWRSRSFTSPTPRCCWRIRRLCFM